MKQIDHHPAESDMDSSPARISDTENQLNWNGDFVNLNNSEDDWVADNESDMERDNGSEDADTQKQRNVSAAPNVPGLIRSLQQSKKNVENVMKMVIIMVMRRNKRIKTE